jgi:hypothetical protein
MTAIRYHYNQGRCYLTIEPRENQFVAVAHNVAKEASMEMSNPRPYANTLQWVLKYIGQVPPVNYDDYDQFLSERLGF